MEQGKIVNRLTSLGVNWRVNEEFAGFEKSGAKFVCAYTGQEKAAVPFDQMIFVGGRLQKAELYEGLKTHIPSQNLSLIGDALTPGLIQAAVYSGHKAVRAFNGEALANETFLRDGAKLQID